MAEAMLRHLAGERFEAFSAGSSPAGFVHPLALEALRRLGIPIGDTRSKSWHEFTDIPLDMVITVCDSAAGESCPAFPGGPLRAHWSLPDPVFHLGPDEERSAFSTLIAERLRRKIEGLIAVDWLAPRDETERKLRFLGEI